MFMPGSAFRYLRKFLQKDNQRKYFKESQDRELKINECHWSKETMYFDEVESFKTNEK